MRLEGKVALVTGAGSGNGAAIGRGYLREGAKVVFADINVEAARNVAADSGASEDRWLAVRLDAGDRASNDACVEAVVARFRRLDIFVANAGITRRRPFLEQTEEDFEAVMRVNSTGVFLGTQAAARVMARQGGGAIIHMASMCSLVGIPNVVGYGASKGAVASMTRHMAIDLAAMNIRVNAIAPGTIVTNLNRERLSDPEARAREVAVHPIGRLGSPEDLVGAAVFLAADESSFMTGAVVPVDGGYSIR